MGPPVEFATSGGEVTSEAIWETFSRIYLDGNGALEFVNYRTVPDAHASEIRHLHADLKEAGEAIEFEGKGNGPIDAFVAAMRRHTGLELSVHDYSEHALGRGADTTATPRTW